ncbi:MAG: hypothetical protein HXX16_16630 [Bacteroidales bacterium]|nr:hypothetical protein [Bacteroidales bacterium]
MKNFKFHFLVAILIISILPAFSQHKKMDQIMEDVFQERDNNVFTIRFFDAVTGDPVEGAEIMIQNIGTFTTDSAGRAIFPRQPDGFLKAIFKKKGYISAIAEIDVAAETILRNRYYVSPTLNIDQFRVVLSWDQQPEDLDAHFVKENSYHISYRNTRVLNDGSGQLDRDDMDGYGPETITVAQLSPDANYLFFVKNYSAEINPSAPSINSSKATVWVFGNNKLINTFHIPSNVTGDTWPVFKIVQGQVIPL